MNDDHFDGLVNDATHAVTNLIPDTVLDGLRDSERSDLLFQINDALTPSRRDVIDRSDTDNPTRACTIAAALVELLETHAQKCDEGGDCADDRPPHVISEIHDTSANIDSIASCDIETGTQIYLVLDDRTSFRITVEAIAA